MIFHNHTTALSHSIFHAQLFAKCPVIMATPLPAPPGGAPAGRPPAPPRANHPSLAFLLLSFYFYGLSFILLIMECRPGCGACCIAASISSPIPGMPGGKPAGVRCIHLSDDFRCDLYNDPQRPKVCRDFMPEPEFCGSTREEAMSILSALSE